MQTINIREPDIDNILYPFMYNGAFIVSSELFGQKGFYGYKEGRLVFYSTEFLESQEIQIDIATSQEELVQYVAMCNTVMLYIALNNNTEIVGLDYSETYRDNISQTEYIEECIQPFKSIVHNYSLSSALLL